MRAWKFMFAFLIQVHLIHLTFILLVSNISLLNENVQNEVDGCCEGGIHFVSFLLTVKTGRNERWSHRLQTVFSLRMSKSMSLQINKVILEWEERVTYATAWDTKMRTSRMGIKCRHSLQSPVICHLHVRGGHYHILLLSTCSLKVMVFQQWFLSLAFLYSVYTHL